MPRHPPDVVEGEESADVQPSAELNPQAHRHAGGLPHLERRVQRGGRRLGVVVEVEVVVDCDAWGMEGCGVRREAVQNYMTRMRD